MLYLKSLSLSKISINLELLRLWKKIKTKVGFVCICVWERVTAFSSHFFFSLSETRLPYHKWVSISLGGLERLILFPYLWVLPSHIWFIWVKTSASDTVGKPSLNLVLICELIWSPTSAFWVMDSHCVPQRLAYRIVSGGLCISFRSTIYCVHPFPCAFILFPSSTLKWNGQQAQMSSTSKVHGMCKSWWRFINKLRKDLNELPNWKTVE